MRRVLLVVGIAACGNAPVTVRDAASDAPSDAAITEDIHFIGRFDAMHRFAWPGTQLRTRFSGTAISVELADTNTNWFDVTIDGVAQPVVQTMSGDHVYPLATSLVDGDHDLVIAKRTESFQGVVTFGGFAGATLVPTPRPTRLIEFIGDSITCGYGDLGTSSACHFSADTESEPLAWGNLAANALAATHAAIAYSGIGMARNGGGNGPTMPVAYARTLADDPTSVWDWSYTPDVIVIDLGTNDYAAGDPGAAFVTTYTTFVTMLKARFPAVKVLLATSPMAAGADRTQLHGYLDQVAASIANPDVTVVDIAQQLASDGLGCDFHPNTVTQQKMATTIVAAIRGVTGW